MIPRINNWDSRYDVTEKARNPNPKYGSAKKKVGRKARPVQQGGACDNPHMQRELLLIK